MKNKFKLIVTAGVLLTGLLTTRARAQTIDPGRVWGSIGLEMNDPTGVARIGSHFSLGGTFRLQYGISDRVAITLTSGAYHFFATKIPGTNQRYDSYGVVPAQGGIKVFFLPQYYIGAEAGIAVEATDAGTGPARVAVAPALGYATRHWDFALHYDNFSSPGEHYGLVGLRLAYAFGL